MTQKTLLALATLAILANEVAAQSNSTAPIDPNVFLNQFEATFGKFEGYRRSGAKGICATGEFVGTSAARTLSTASVFSGRPIPVVVRFSVGGANPRAADNTKSQRNMALQFDLPDGEQWQMGNISAPVFGASTPQQFLGRLASLQPDPATRMPDPAKVKAFADINPEVLELLIRELDISDEDVYHLPSPLDLTGLFEIASLKRPDLHYPPHQVITNRFLKPVEDKDVSIFAALRQRGIVA